MYESWLHDQEEEIDRLRHHGILVGSFFNHEAAKQMMTAEKPTHKSSDEEALKVMEKIRKEREGQEQAKASKGHRRKRRKPVNKDI